MSVWVPRCCLSVDRIVKHVLIDVFSGIKGSEIQFLKHRHSLLKLIKTRCSLQYQSELHTQLKYWVLTYTTVVAALQYIYSITHENEIKIPRNGSNSATLERFPLIVSIWFLSEMHYNQANDCEIGRSHCVPEIN